MELKLKKIKTMIIQVALDLDCEYLNSLGDSNTKNEHIESKISRLISEALSKVVKTNQIESENPFISKFEYRILVLNNEDCYQLFKMLYDLKGNTNEISDIKKLLVKNYF